jgi:hypothetical protein
MKISETDLNACYAVVACVGDGVASVGISAMILQASGSVINTQVQYPIPSA